MLLTLAIAFSRSGSPADTTLARIKRWLPFLFARVQFAELSPFGVTNLANTNVQAIEGRLFVGYDAEIPVGGESGGAAHRITMGGTIGF